MLTYKAKRLLKKYQMGDMVQGSAGAQMGVSPLQTLPPGLDFMKPVQSINPQVNAQMADFGLGQLNQAPKLPQMSRVPQSMEMTKSEQAASTMGTVADSLGIFGTGLKMATGAVNIYNSIKAKKRQKKLDKYQKEDLAERQRDVRLNAYTNTPYGSYQMGGTTMDAFSDSYQRQQDYNKDIQNNWQEYYEDLNTQRVSAYKAQRNQGITQYAGAVGDMGNMALKFLQEGGEPNPNLTDINSEEFDPNVFLGTEQEKQVTQSNESDELMKWVMEDEDTYSPIQEEYQNYSPVSSGVGSSSDIISRIGESETHGNYSLVNDTTGTTGKYQFHPRWWADKIKTYGNMPAEYNQAQVMETFKNDPTLQENFMNHVVEDIYKPEIRKLKPYMEKYGLNEEEMVRLLHYRGLDDATDRLKKDYWEIKPEEKAKYKNPNVWKYIKNQL